MNRRGFLTTEFWITVATDVGVVAAALANALPAKWAAVAASVSTVGYAISRGLTKVTPPAVAVTGTPVQTTAPVVAATPPSQ